LTPAWAGAAQWRVLDVGVDSSTHFLRSWQVWRADPQRPRLLHYVAICGDSFQNTDVETDVEPLAEALNAQLWGLLPGFHRLVFEGGQVLLTVCVGDVQTLLKQQWFEADSVFLNPQAYASADALYTVKAITRLCRRGTAFAAPCSDTALQAALMQCGFETSSPDGLQAIYGPAWSSTKSIKLRPAMQPGNCVVIGAGLAGAAAASSLARRGWAVTVLDAASQPASGASSLPAGLLVPHTSPDDSPLSRLSRSGVRITLQQARAQLRHGIDWGHTGVLQRSLADDLLHLPPAWTLHQSEAASDWCYSASPQTLAAAGLPPESTALWHAQAGWVKPSALVKAWLQASGTSPAIEWRGDAQVAKLTPLNGGWQVLNAAGDLLMQADLVVISAGFNSQTLTAASGVAPPDMQAIRGQVTFGLQHESAQLPRFPVNGHGGLIPGISTPDGPLWLMGASYERDQPEPQVRAQDHADNLARLQKLLPQAADALANQFDPERAQGWAGVRCATPNRLPLVMPLPGASQVWLCTGMGSRGLSFAALCAELLAAQLHREPLPVDRRLAEAMQQAM
jgi:tRNA 5-methylaminomethyl-2-thiouridine biosynthesis bifunctional protein